MADASLRVPGVGSGRIRRIALVVYRAWEMSARSSLPAGAVAERSVRSAHETLFTPQQLGQHGPPLTPTDGFGA
jgi:hypothetical protein